MESFIMLAVAAWVSACPSPKQRVIGKKATRRWQKKAITVALVAVIIFLFGIIFPSWFQEGSSSLQL